jgi:alkylation response protein AidB-like acyl-CoA dehydrogenase
MAQLPTELKSWIESNADDFDECADGAASILPRLADVDVLRIGVPRAQGGLGGHINDAVGAIAAVSSHSLAAGFVFWGHRTFIEYLLRSPNERLRDRLLPDLLSGRRAGATGLSNAMKFLSGVEALQIKAAAQDGVRTVTGKLPWVTNLRAAGFDVAAAVQGEGGSTPFVARLSSDNAGVRRSPDLALMGMRASSTAAVDLDGVRVNDDDIIHPDAGVWLPQVRPAFLGLQCAMSIGLARRSLAETELRLNKNRDVLAAEVDALSRDLDVAEGQLAAGLLDARFIAVPAPLFRIRLRLAAIVSGAVQLELAASGGEAYLSEPGRSFQRRLREAAFVPIITPSLVQLKTVLREHERRQAIVETA